MNSVLVRFIAAIVLLLSSSNVLVSQEINEDSVRNRIAKIFSKTDQLQPHRQDLLALSENQQVEVADALASIELQVQQCLTLLNGIRDDKAWGDSERTQNLKVALELVESSDERLCNEILKPAQLLLVIHAARKSDLKKYNNDHLLMMFERYPEELNLSDQQKRQLVKIQKRFMIKVREASGVVSKQVADLEEENLTSLRGVLVGDQKKELNRLTLQLKDWPKEKEVKSDEK